MQLVHCACDDAEGITPVHLLISYMDGSKGKSNSFVVGAMENANVLRDVPIIVALVLYRHHAQCCTMLHNFAF